MRSVLCLLLAFLVTLATTLRAQTPLSGRRPNVILILADDLGYGDLGCYGQREIQTPNLDKLAAQGIRFTQFYAGSSVCAPSRSVLMTGLHNGHGRIRDNIPHGVHLMSADLTIAELLQRAGYRTGAIGKWSLGDHGTAGAPWLKGFEDFYGYANQDHAHIYYTDFLWDNNRVVLLPGNRGEQRRQYVPDLLTERALSFLERSRDDSRPFFLYFATILPHWSDHPQKSPDSHLVPSDEPYSNRNWPPVEKNYAAMVTRLDRDVGRIVDQLKRLGLEENTLVIFSSDNGPSAETIHQPAFFKSAGPLRGTKRQLYEGSIRVPAILRWPGVIRTAAVNDSIAGFVDVLPTLAELARTSEPPGLDGISFAPLLHGQPREREHEFLYWDYGHARDQFMQAVRAGKWKAVRNALDKPVELYDLSTDFAEERDIAQQNPGIVVRLTNHITNAYVPSADYPLKSAKSAKP